MAESITLTPEELVNLTSYKQAATQLAELHRMGFWRARRSRLTGKVILERAHYEAVCHGEKPAPRETRRPQLQPV
jgi:hypothetical protein